MNGVPDGLLSNELLPVALSGHELEPLVRRTSLVKLGKRDLNHTQKAALDLILVVDLEEEDIVDRGNEEIKFLIPYGIWVVVDDGSFDGAHHLLDALELSNEEGIRLALSILLQEAVCFNCFDSDLEFVVVRVGVHD
jgi:hypothetical protein